MRRRPLVRGFAPGGPSCGISSWSGGWSCSARISNWPPRNARLWYSSLALRARFKISSRRFRGSSPRSTGGIGLSSPGVDRCEATSASAPRLKFAGNVAAARRVESLRRISATRLTRPCPRASGEDESVPHGGDTMTESPSISRTTAHEFAARTTRYVGADDVGRSSGLSFRSATIAALASSVAVPRDF